MARINCPLHQSAAISGREPVCKLPDRLVLYRELEMRVRSTAEDFATRGLESGDILAFALMPGLDYLTYLFAAFRSGVIVAPLNTRLPLATLQEQASTLGAKNLVLDAAPATDSLAHDIELPQYDMDQVSTLLFTSGSSAEPKIVQHSFGAHYYSALGSNQHMKLQSGDCWLLSLPLYHVGGLGIVFRCILAGASLAFPNDDERIIDSLFRSGCSHVSMVPTQLKEVLAHPELSKLQNQLKVILLGGASISHDVLQEAYDAGLPVLPTYGLTEMASQVATMPMHAGKRKLGSAGVIVPNRELRINDEGRIQVRGKTRFDGYWCGGQLERPFDSEGWFTTGDLGGVDDEDYLWVKGRADRLIISGGENINPQEIEDLLLKLWPKTQCAVVPVADEKFGERPVLFIRGEGSSFEQVLESLNDVLPRYKIPVAAWSWPDDLEGGMKVPYAALKARAKQLYSQSGT